jgi:hypothetical protein
MCIKTVLLYIVSNQPGSLQRKKKNFKSTYFFGENKFRNRFKENSPEMQKLTSHLR